MNRCLSERALVRVYFNEASADEHAHLRLCADCAESYDRLVDDLDAIHETLATVPPPKAADTRLAPWRWGWLAAAFSVAAVAVVVSVVWLREPAPVQLAAGTRSVSAFATDVSTALFAGADSDDVAEIGEDAPYLHAALEAGQPCTENAFFNGECSDQVSALLIETD